MKSHEEYIASINQKADVITKKRKQRTRFISSAAACLVLVICAIAITPGLVGNNPVVDNPESTGKSSGQQTTPGNPDTTPVVHINMITDIVDANRAYHDPEKTYEETWDWNKVTDYLGKDITPDYITPGLKINPQLTEQKVVFNNDGTIAYDAIWLEYYTEYLYEDGSQAIGGNATGIRIIASKAGYSEDCIYVWQEDMKESNLGDVVVKLGHRQIGYGGTYENPDSYYDLYVAEFEKDGIGYQVISSNISEEEFVKMVNSLTQK